MPIKLTPCFCFPSVLIQKTKKIQLLPSIAITRERMESDLDNQLMNSEELQCWCSISNLLVAEAGHITSAMIGAIDLCGRREAVTLVLKVTVDMIYSIEIKRKETSSFYHHVDIPVNRCSLIAI